VYCIILPKTDRVKMIFHKKSYLLSYKTTFTFIYDCKGATPSTVLYCAINFIKILYQQSGRDHVSTRYGPGRDHYRPVRDKAGTRVRTKGGHRHLQMGRMLDSDLISEHPPPPDV
jgi:hypothetical protein